MALIIAVICVIVAYQLFFYLIYQDPVQIIASADNATSNHSKARNVHFKISNRLAKAFSVEKIILKIGDHHHTLRPNELENYPVELKGFEEYVMKLPQDVVQRIVETNISNWHKTMVKISIVIRGNNGSFTSNQVKI